MKKISLLICIFTLSVLTMTACGSNVNDSGDKEEDTRTVIDCAGDEVIVPTEINRVVCVTQTAMEFMVAMGQEEKLVAVHKSIWAHTWSSEFLSKMDSYEPLGYLPAMEKLYEIEPDLVIVRDATTAEDLRDAGITAITFKYSNEEELFQAVELLGDLINDESRAFADKWIAEYQDAVSDVQTALMDMPEEEKVKLYFIDASVSMDAGGLCTTVGGNHIVAEWLRASGASLITEDYSDISEINEEAILAMNPEAILIGGWSENARKEQLLEDVKWSDVSAVKSGRIFMSPVGFISFERYGVEAPILIRYTASQLYPSRYEYSTVGEFKKFFKEFYGLDVSDEKINYMLEGYSPDGTRMD